MREGLNKITRFSTLRQITKVKLPTDAFRNFVFVLFFYNFSIVLLAPTKGKCQMHQGPPWTGVVDGGCLSQQ